MKKKNLTQEITDTLRNWILQNKFTAGQKIEEIPLAQLLNASRTPIRAALTTLANEGLILHEPKKGYSINSFDDNVIFNAYEVRAILEGYACRTAAQQGLSEQQSILLKKQLTIGDEILAKGKLLEEDLIPYQQMNTIIHDTLIEAAHNPWLERFIKQTHQIPYASNRVILWNLDYRIMYQSHQDHHRIIQAIIDRDPYRAETLMKEHVYYAGIIFKKYRQNEYD